MDHSPVERFQHRLCISLSPPSVSTRQRVYNHLKVSDGNTSKEMLCEKCSNIHFKHLEDCEPMQQEPSRLLGNDMKYNISRCLFYFHHKNKSDLESSANRGCHFCAALLRRLFKEGSHGGRSYYFAREEVIFRRAIIDRWVEKENGLKEWSIRDWIYIECQEQRVTTTGISEFSGIIAAMLQALTSCANVDPTGLTGKNRRDMSIVIENDELRFVSPDLAPTLNPGIYSPWLDTSTTSPASMALASLWMKNCLQNHRPCQISQKEYKLPSHIIDISNPRHPFLDEGKDREDKYITLSYKWGETKKFVTTLDNLPAHRTEIPFKDLPWTFKDAINVASTLGFRWLWIDALCIIQDSEEDQQREIAAMDRIFQSSVLTLFALAGENADAGLSIPRDPRWVKPCRLNIATTLHGKTVHGKTHLKLDYGGQPSGPLFTRGWVLQEQVLSTRGLVFGTREFAWRCICGSSTETSPKCVGRTETLQELGTPEWDTWRSYSSGWDGLDLLRMWLQSKDPLPDRSPWHRDNQFDHWYNLVKTYSERSLTFSSDILPALAGISSALATTHGCTYLAGLWLEDLQVGLTWYIKKPSDAGGEEQEELFHGNSLSLPSWSWIAQWGKLVDFRYRSSNSTHIEAEGVKLINTSSLLEASGLNGFAGVAKTFLVLTGLVRVAMVDQRPWWQQELGREHHEGARWASNIKDPVSGEIVGQIALDSSLGVVPVRLVHCLLGTARKGNDWELTCLGLVPIDLTGEDFTRIGLVFLRKTDWFTDVSNIDLALEVSWGLPPKDPRFERTIRVF